MPNERIYIEDTIVASASGDGSAGVNVIRVSGPDTEEIASILLKSPVSYTHLTLPTIA